jgi:phosphoenolpyruvate carboxykinase (GTP)
VPVIDPEWENPKGVPISAFLFGGRVSRHFPLAFQSYNWEHGVYLAATMGSEATAAAIGQAAVRRDPMAMLPFCGYNMADYWRHWLRIGRAAWPPRRGSSASTGSARTSTGASSGRASARTCGCSKWIVERCNGSGSAVESPLGWIPDYEAFNWDGLDFDRERFYSIMNIDREVGAPGDHDQEELFTRFGDHLPRELESERELQLARLFHSPALWDLSSTGCRTAPSRPVR